MTLLLGEGWVGTKNHELDRDEIPTKRGNLGLFGPLMCCVVA